MLELKGELHELVAGIQSMDSAKKLRDIIRDFVQNQSREEYDDEFEDNMTDEQVAILERAIEMTYHKHNLIPQSEAEKLIEQWLNQRMSNG